MKKIGLLGVFVFGILFGVVDAAVDRIIRRADNLDLSLHSKILARGIDN